MTARAFLQSHRIKFAISFIQAGQVANDKAVAGRAGPLVAGDLPGGAANRAGLYIMLRQQCFDQRTLAGADVAAQCDVDFPGLLALAQGRQFFHGAVGIYALGLQFVDIVQQVVLRAYLSLRPRRRRPEQLDQQPQHNRSHQQRQQSVCQADWQWRCGQMFPDGKRQIRGIEKNRDD